MVLALQFAALALVVMVAASSLVRCSDAIAHHTGLGRGWVGVVFLATATSLPELATGVSSAGLYEFADIAAGDVFGSCMFNLLILGALDAWSASPLSTRAHQGHVITAGLSLGLLGASQLALAAGPAMPAIGWVSVVTVGTAAVYLLGVGLIRADERRRAPVELPDEGVMSLRRALVLFGVNALVVAVAAILLPGVAGRLAGETGLGQTFVGTFLVAITTSMPELLTAVAALRMGAVDLLFGNILGSNVFNMVVLAVDDVAYRDGPLLAAASPDHAVSIAAATIMTAAVLIGMTYRAERKHVPLAWDSLTVVATFAASALLLAALA